MRLSGLRFSPLNVNRLGEDKNQILNCDAENTKNQECLKQFVWCVNWLYKYSLLHVFLCHIYVSKLMCKYAQPEFRSRKCFHKHWHMSRQKIFGFLFIYLCLQQRFGSFQDFKFYRYNSILTRNSQQGCHINQ